MIRVFDNHKIITLLLAGTNFTSRQRAISFPFSSVSHCTRIITLKNNNRAELGQLCRLFARKCSLSSRRSQSSILTIGSIRSPSGVINTASLIRSESASRSQTYDAVPPVSLERSFYPRETGEVHTSFPQQHITSKGASRYFFFFF